MIFCFVTEYEIATTTANTDDASTSENAWIVLEGRRARSKEFVLENKRKKFLRQDLQNTSVVLLFRVTGSTVLHVLDAYLLQNN